MARGGARRTAALGLVLRLLLGFGLGLEAAPTPVPIPFLAHSPGESSAPPARVPLGGPTPPRAPAAPRHWLFLWSVPDTPPARGSGLQCAVNLAFESQPSPAGDPRLGGSACL